MNDLLVFIVFVMLPTWCMSEFVRFFHISDKVIDQENSKQLIQMHDIKPEPLIKDAVLTKQDIREARRCGIKIEPIPTGEYRYLHGWDIIESVVWFLVALVIVCVVC